MAKKRTSLKEIADKLGISPATVSIYLKDRNTRRVGEKTKAGIDKMVAELNFRPNMMARGLSEMKSRIVAVILPFNGSLFQNAFINSILAGIQSVLFRRNHSMLFLPIRGEDSHSMIGDALAAGSGVDGYIVFGTRYCSNDDLEKNVESLSGCDTPFVLVNMPELAADINQVFFRDPPTSDPYRYLRELGHRRVVLMNGRPTNAESDLNSELHRNHFESDLGKRRKDYVLYGDFEASVAKSAMIRWLEKKLPFSAIYCLNEEMASGVYEALAEAGLSIPGDVSVLGRNDSLLSMYLQPSLTTVARQLFEEGALAAESLLLSIADPTSTRKLLVESRLIVRMSTGPCIH